VAERFTRLEDVLADDTFDAMRLLTPVPLHVEQMLAVLAANGLALPRTPPSLHKSFMIACHAAAEVFTA
jgi:hypothetical protein